MRKCIRCGNEMKENCAIKVEGAGYGIILSSDETKLFGGEWGSLKLRSVRIVERYPFIWKILRNLALE